MDLTSLMNKQNYITLKATQGNHFGKKILSMQCTANQVLKFIEIDRAVQRDLIDQHVSEIQKYIQYGLDGNNIYFPPIILSARGKGTFDEEKHEYKISLDEKLILLDGQHRIKAFEMIEKRLAIRNNNDNLKFLNYVKNFPFTLQIFMDISKKEEKQLFTDVNTKSSKVNNTLLIMYKNNDLCGKLVKDIINNHPTISSELFEVRSKYTKTKIMTSAVLHNVIITLNDGILHTGRVKSKIIEETYDIYKDRTIEFLELINRLLPINLYNRSKSIVYLPKVLIGIAYFVGDSLRKYEKITMYDIFINVLSKIDWSQSNKLFKELGLPFNENTKRYNMSNGIRGTKIIIKYLNEYLEMEMTR